MEKSKIKQFGFDQAKFQESDGLVTRIDLDKNSWLTLIKFTNDDLSEILGYEYCDEMFDELWKLQPKKPGTVMMPRKDPETGITRRMAIDVPRKQLGYLRPYHFSGINHKPAKVTPKPFLSFLDHANELGYGTFNEILVNWYADGSDYIGMHADSPNHHVRDPDHGFVVYSLTLWEEIGQPRLFRIKPIKGGRDRIDVPLEHGILVMMCGDMQKHYKHGVPAFKKKTGRRINITMRQFKEK